MRTAILLVLLAGCGSNPKPAADKPEPTASMISCDQAAEHVAQTAQQSAKLRGDATYEAIKNLVTNRCTADAWSDEAKQCLFTINTIQDGRACKSKMTDAQQQALHADARALVKDQASGPTETNDNSDDWIKHVVEEPAPPGASPDWKPAPKS
jgi:hypothetical protein